MPGAMLVMVTEACFAQPREWVIRVLGVGFSTGGWWCCVCGGLGVCGVGWGCVGGGCGVGFSFAAAHGLPGFPGRGCGCVVVV